MDRKGLARWERREEARVKRGTGEECERDESSNMPC